MSLSGCITTLSLQRGACILEQTGMVGVGTYGPIVHCANVGVSLSVFQTILCFALLPII